VYKRTEREIKEDKRGSQGVKRGIIRDKIKR
jgi:hypothetical protein